jgi:hypothetical protein
MPASPSAQAQLNISRIATERMIVPVVSTSPLIMHRFSDKAKRQMLDAQQGRKSPKERRDPEADYEAAFYRTKDGFGFPAVGFKACTISAARFFGKDVRMTDLRQFLFFKGILSEKDPQPLIEIVGEPRMREDVVRLGISGTDLRYRPEFPEWTADLEVVYVKSALTLESVLSLIDAGGLGVGVGEWRPEKKGDFGTFQIDPTKDVVMIS